MGYIDTAKEVSKYANKAGTLSFIISGIGISFNYYIPNVIPSKFVGNMYWVVLLSSLTMLYFFVIHFKSPHNSNGEICPICQRSILYTGIKCSNPDCNYVAKFK